MEIQRTCSRDDPIVEFASLGPLKSTIRKELGINNAQYGVIASSGNLVNTVVPFLSGIAIDYYGPEWLSLGASTIILLGGIVSGVGATVKSYGALVTGEVLVGLGSVTVETAQLKIYTHWAHGSHLGLIYGLNNAVNRVILVVAKATAIPIVNSSGWIWFVPPPNFLQLHSLTLSLPSLRVIWIPAFISFFVLLVNLAYFIFERKIPQHLRALTGRETAKMHGGGGLKVELKKSWEVVTSLPAVFWLFTLTQLRILTLDLKSHRYSNVFYFFMALKAVDFFIGIYYI
ncbi:hypothetical protein P7C70_g2154, partial [Phenoliferia sp. Uapishka_3]